MLHLVQILKSLINRESQTIDQLHSATFLNILIDAQTNVAF